MVTENTNTAEEMNKENQAYFMAGLQHYIKESGQTQDAVAIKAGTTGVTMSKYINKRGNSTKNWRDKVLAALNIDESELVMLGKRLLNPLGGDKLSSYHVSLAPAQQAGEPGQTGFSSNGFDNICAAATGLAATLQTLANQQRKEQERLEMWNEVFEMLPNPTLIVRNGIIEFQNKMSLIWGRLTGGPLCGTCLDDQCDGDDCKLKEAMATHQETRAYKFIRDDFYKLIISPMRYGGLEYFIVSATEINECFEAFRDEDRRKHTERRKKPRPEGGEQ
ncbi:MAG TPA: hypothetical protein DCS42_04165 [Nitrospiraceae bacterium]|nr:hypothetical protein [Nitrospiraceae bacterium]